MRLVSAYLFDFVVGLMLIAAWCMALIALPFALLSGEGQIWWRGYAAKMLGFSVFALACVYLRSLLP